MARTTTPVRKLPSGRWQARYRDDQGRQRKRTFDTARDARAFLDDTRSAVRTRRYIDPAAGRETFASFAERWAAGQDWKESTRESFGAHLKRLATHLGGMQLDQVDELVLRNLRAALLERYAVNTATVATVIASHYVAADGSLSRRDPNQPQLTRPDTGLPPDPMHIGRPTTNQEDTTS